MQNQNLQNQKMAAPKEMPTSRKGMARVESTFLDVRGNAQLRVFVDMDKDTQQDADIYDWMLSSETRRIGKAGVKLALQALKVA